ncbi:MAG: hypothetical protein J6B79_01005 [Clostridia bacterium]|nr:hypothetical protein [Clostridia bacterium]
MKVSKRFFLALLSLILIVNCSLFVGCREKLPPVPPRPHYYKSYLYVQNYSRGYDNEWLIALADRFEEEYKDVSFESGRMGVQIIIDNSHNKGNDILKTIEGSRNNVFFTEESCYYDFVNSGLVANITDIVTEDLGAYGEEGVTIEDKLSPQQKEFFKTNNKYYAIPHYSSYFGISYDVDLFEEKGFYFAADPNVDANTTPYNTYLNNGNDCFIFDKTDAKSNGPDGKPNTYDDGLPATYDEFFLLCKYIQSALFTPIIWTGEYRNDYIQKLLQALATDYEGAEQMMLNYSLDGTAKNLIKSIDENGKIEFNEPTAITNENGYEMLKSAGRYYALDFYQRLSSNTAYYHNKNFNKTQSHIMAQQDFLFSYAENVSPIAMIVDDSWWEDQSKEAFRDISAQYGEEFSRKNRRFAMMPLPKATKEQIGEPFTLLDSHNSIAFINANCSKSELDLAKTFLQFANTQESLVEFTLTTNAPKALNYELTNEQINEMTHFGKSLWSIKESGNVVYPLSTNEFFKDNQSALNYHDFFQADISDKTYNSVADDLRGTNASHVSAKDFFNGIIAKYDSIWWNDTFGEWFNSQQ